MVELSEDLVRGPVLRRTLEAAGLSCRELRGALWRAPHRGVRAWALLPEDDPDTRLQAAALLLPPDAALGGWAAARLLGATASDGTTPAGETLPVLLVIPPRRRMAARAGIEVLRSVLLPGERVRRRGIVVTTPARTALDLACRLERDDAVPLVDALLRATATSPAAVAELAAAHPRGRGLPRARATLRLCDPAAESPMESRFRLVWHEAGRRGVASNVEVHDRAGHFLGRVDVLDEEAGVFGEYDGEVHAPREVRSRDYRRQRGLEQAGLLCVRATARDVLGDRGPLLRDIASTVERGLARDRSRDGWLAVR